MTLYRDKVPAIPKVDFDVESESVEKTLYAEGAAAIIRTRTLRTAIIAVGRILGRCCVMDHEPFWANRTWIGTKSRSGNPNPMSVLVQDDSMMVIGVGESDKIGKWNGAEGDEGGE